MKYGHRIVAADGQTVILDDRGIMQTWEVSKEDNVDASNPLVLDVHIPPSAEDVVKARLRLRLKPFRAYSRGNASGGGDTVTSRSGGGISTSTKSGGGTTRTTGIQGIDVNEKRGYTDSSGKHNHGIADGTVLVDKDGNWIPFVQKDHHTHNVFGHTHEITIPSHSHKVNIDAHSHSVDIPSHTHSINYGIYTSTTATGTTIKINGTDRTSELGGPFSSSQNGINIAQHLTAGQWNTIVLGSTRLGRIDATIFIQALMGT